MICDLWEMPRCNQKMIRSLRDDAELEEGDAVNRGSGLHQKTLLTTKYFLDCSAISSRDLHS